MSKSIVEGSRKEKMIMTMKEIDIIIGTQGDRKTMKIVMMSQKSHGGTLRNLEIKTMSNLIIIKEEIVKKGNQVRLKCQKIQQKVKDKPNNSKSKNKKMNNIKKSIRATKNKNKREKEVETVLKTQLNKKEENIPIMIAITTLRTIKILN
jgi:hypothetical protein